MIVSIHQPNYLPWLAYFRKIADADRFVFFDNVQMPIGKSLVSRNRVKTAQGVRWLTVPTDRLPISTSRSSAPSPSISISATPNSCVRPGWIYSEMVPTRSVKSSRNRALRFI
jgi:hypothetical protein